MADIENLGSTPDDASKTPEKKREEREEQERKSALDYEKKKEIWLTPLGRASHEPRFTHSSSKAVAPEIPPKGMPVLPELTSADLKDRPDLFNVGPGNVGEASSHSLLHNPNPCYRDEGRDEEGAIIQVKQTCSHTFQKWGRSAQCPFPSLAEGRGSLYQRIKARDPEVVPALFSEEEAEMVLASEQKPPKADGLLKQVYVTAGDGKYLLMGPVTSTQMVGQVSDAVWDIRKTKGVWLPKTIHTGLGGSNPQNLGSVAIRLRKTILLPCLPPKWEFSPRPYKTSLFDKWRGGHRTKKLFTKLDKFLASDPPSNLRTREKRDSLMRSIIKDLLAYRAFCREEPGWTTSCGLPDDQKAWLDPACEPLPVDGIINTFGFVVDECLPSLTMDQVDRDYWRDLFREELRLQGDLT